VEIDGELMLPMSAINALRRAAIEKLSETINEKRELPQKTDNAVTQEKRSPAAKGRTAYFHFADRIPDSARSFFDIIYVPIEQYDGSTNGAFLPPVIYDSEEERIDLLINRAKELGCEHILLGNVGHIELVKKHGLKIHGDLRLNVCNSVSARHFEGELEDVILSPELTIPKLRDIKKAAPYSRIQIYGRTPLMVTEKCVGKEISNCKSCTEGNATLTDRRGVSFPVLRSFEHRSLIVNSVPLYMADKQDELYRAGLNAHHFIFTTESKKEVEKVIHEYTGKLPPKIEVRRIK
jgi:putative protease